MTHYDSKAVYAAASEQDEARYQLSVIELEEGDTAWNPASTKPERQIHGPATVRYLLHPSGINFTIDSKEK